MMISENPEPKVEEMEVEDDDIESSRVNPLEEQIPKQESNDMVLEVDSSEDNMLKDEKEVSKESHEENIEQTSPNPNINIFGAGFFMMYAEDSEKLADKQESNLDPKDVEDPAVEYKLKGNQQDVEDPALEDKEKVPGREKVAEDPALEEKEKLKVHEKNAEDPNVKESKKIDDKEDPSLDADDSVVEETEKLEENT